MFGDQTQRSELLPFETSSAAAAVVLATLATSDDSCDNEIENSDITSTTVPTTAARRWQITSFQPSSRWKHHPKMITSASAGDGDNCSRSPSSSPGVQSSTGNGNSHTMMSSRASAFSIAALMQDRSTSVDDSRKRRCHDVISGPDVVAPCRRRRSVSDDNGNELEDDVIAEDDDDVCGSTVSGLTKCDVACSAADIGERYRDGHVLDDDVMNGDRKSSWLIDNERCLERQYIATVLYCLFTHIYSVYTHAKQCQHR